MLLKKKRSLECHNYLLLTTNTDTDQFEYYLSSLDELGEILIEADNIESVASGILRLTLGTIMASNGAIFFYNEEGASISQLCSIGIDSNTLSINLSDSFIVNLPFSLSTTRIHLLFSYTK